MTSSPLALITGSAKRLGRIASTHLATKGYRLALHYNLSNSEVLLLQEELLENGCDCEVFQADLKDPSEARLLLQNVEIKMGPVDLLINNASFFESPLSTDFPLSGDWENNRSLHLDAPLILIEYLANNSQNALVINMLDTRIAQNKNEYFSYTLSKKALENLTYMSASALAPKIRVVGIAPGILLQPVGKEWDVMKEKIDNTPLSRAPTLDHFRSTLDYLIHTSCITGQIIYLNGGEHLN